MDGSEGETRVKSGRCWRLGSRCGEGKRLGKENGRKVFLKERRWKAQGSRERSGNGKQGD